MKLYLLSETNTTSLKLINFLGSVGSVPYFL